MSVMSKPKYNYIMDYIPNKNTYKAVMFACKMIKSGTGFHQAIRTACRYHGADMDEVRHYVAQRGGRIRNERR